jgi:hypothetical protein
VTPPTAQVMAILCLDGTVRFVNAATGHLVSLLGGASAVCWLTCQARQGQVETPYSHCMHGEIRPGHPLRMALTLRSGPIVLVKI